MFPLEWEGTTPQPFSKNSHHNGNRKSKIGTVLKIMLQELCLHYGPMSFGYTGSESSNERLPDWHGRLIVDRKTMAVYLRRKLPPSPPGKYRAFG